MTGRDRMVRWAAVAAVMAVAAVAAWVSYRHCVAVVESHGETGWVGRVYPATIDGLIVAASMVLLDAARSQDKPPAMAVWLLSTGIAATLAVNVLAGVKFGPLGALISAWPAYAFVGAYEALMLLVRAAARRAAGATTEPAVRTTRKASPRTTRKASAKASGGGVDAATRKAAEAIELGQPLPSARALARDHHIGRDKATQIRATVLAEANGHGGQPGQLTST